LLANDELGLAHSAYGKDLSFERAITDDFEVLGHVNQIELVCCTYEEVSALDESAVHHINRQLFEGRLRPVCYHIHFSLWIAYQHEFRRSKSTGKSYHIQVNLKPVALILEYSLSRGLIEACLDELL